MRVVLPIAVLAALALTVPLRGQIAGAARGPAAEAGLLTGQVVDAAGAAPIAAVVITLNGTGASPNSRNPPRVLTDAQGHFFFSDVAPGSYTITATKPGWLPGAVGRRRPGGQASTIDVRPGDLHSDLSIPLWRTGIITGRVLDEAGEPLVGVDVRVFRRTFSAGHAQWRFAVRAITDDRGVYRLAALAPGDYIVSVPATVSSTPASLAADAMAQTYLLTMTATGAAPMNFRPATTAVPGTDVRVSSPLSPPTVPTAAGAWTTFATTYYPSVTNTNGATVLAVASGRERTGVDVVVRMQQTWQVAGSVTLPEGGPAVHHAVHLVPADAADTPIVDTATATTDGQGHFVFYGVPAGQYVARVVRVPIGPGWQASLCGGTGAIQSICTFSQTPGPPAVPETPLLFADTPLTVAGRSVSDLTLALRPGARVSGRAQFDGTAPLPTDAQWANMRISLDAADGRNSIGAGGFDNTPPGAFSPDGTFKLPSTLPGRYLLRVAGVPSGWTLKDATLQGRELSEQAFDLSEDTSDVIVTFTDRPSKIEGAVSPGNTQATTLVLIFPTRNTAWTDFGRGGRTVSSVTVRNGRFTLPAPPAGDYFLVAVSDDDATDWQRPAFLTRAASLADRVTVADGASLSHDLTLKHIQ